MLKLIVATLSILAFSFSALAQENWHATHFKKKTNRQVVLFKSSRTDTMNGGKLSHTTISFTDPDGVELAHEEVNFENGSIKNYHMDQKQVNENGGVEIRDGKILFTYTRDGKTKTDDEKLTDNFVVAPTTVAYVLKNWKTVMDGGTVTVRFAALDRLETVGFKFFKIGEEKRGNDDVVLVKMKPTSFVIAAIVDPLIFVFDKQGTKMLELTGRTLPKIKVDGKFKDIDVESVYKYD